MKTYEIQINGTAIRVSAPTLEEAKRVAGVAAGCYPSWRIVPTSSQSLPPAAGEAAVTQWLDQPNSSGWWLWREGGRGREEKLLLTADGRRVADDDEWEQATGRKAEADGFQHNYWSGTETTQKMMPGTWSKAGEAAHTPTPWKVDPAHPTTLCHGFSTVGELALTYGLAIAQANAAFIVRACNSQAGLVTALRDLVANLDSDLSGYWTEGTANLVQQARVVLKSAQGGWEMNGDCQVRCPVCFAEEDYSSRRRADRRVKEFSCRDGASSQQTIAALVVALTRIEKKSRQDYDETDPLAEIGAIARDALASAQKGEIK